MLTPCVTPLYFFFFFFCPFFFCPFSRPPGFLCLSFFFFTHTHINPHALYFISNMESRSAFALAAIFRDTVSGDPTYSDPCSISRSNSARCIGGQPRSAPIRSRMTL